ncbi:unnamed protein product [Sphenostylis stenocarpa]|uniref:Uncharacterized protein n=1 Tax=Sphenostylis stenocarpa TaxID=92480 RepID=A0AA86SSP1_9FABA|nr:unnamed protein product [Sphenostylis stenocarpa]
MMQRTVFVLAKTKARPSYFRAMEDDAKVVQEVLKNLKRTKKICENIVHHQECVDADNFQKIRRQLNVCIIEKQIAVHYRMNQKGK